MTSARPISRRSARPRTSMSRFAQTFSRSRPMRHPSAPRRCAWRFRAAVGSAAGRTKWSSPRAASRMRGFCFCRTIAPRPGSATSTTRSGAGSPITSTAIPGISSRPTRRPPRGPHIVEDYAELRRGAGAIMAYSLSEAVRRREGLNGAAAFFRKLGAHEYQSDRYKPGGNAAAYFADVARGRIFLRPLRSGARIRPSARRPDRGPATSREEDAPQPTGESPAAADADRGQSASRQPRHPCREDGPARAPAVARGLAHRRRRLSRRGSNSGPPLHGRMPRGG